MAPISNQHVIAASLVGAITAGALVPFFSYCSALYINHNFPQNMGTWVMFQAAATVGIVPFAAACAFRVTRRLLLLRRSIAFGSLLVSLAGLVPLAFLAIHCSWAHLVESFLVLTLVSGPFLSIVPVISGGVIAVASATVLSHAFRYLEVGG